MKSVRVLYFAMLREARGCDEETVATAAATVGELYEALRAQHGFAMAARDLRAAVNETFCEWSHPLAEGDRVAFLAPVAGG